MLKHIKVSFGLICFFGVVTTVARLLDAAPFPGAPLFPPGPEWFDEQIVNFKEHFWLTQVHVLSALIFMLLAPFQFSSSFRANHLGIHKIMGKAFVLTTCISAFSGVGMGIFVPFGGVPEVMFVFLLAPIQLYCVYQALYHIKKREIARHREWMIRVFASGSGVVTMRAMDAILFYSTDINARTIFWVTLYLGVIVNLMVAEYWIRRTRKAKNVELPLRVNALNSEA